MNPRVAANRNKQIAEGVTAMNIRLETPADHKAVELLTFAAFEAMKLPGRAQTDEHYLAHIMRGAPELDFVGEQGKAAEIMTLKPIETNFHKHI